MQFEYDLIRVEDPRWGIFRVIDPLGHSTVIVGIDNYFHTCCPNVRPMNGAKITHCWPDCGAGRGDH